MQSEHSSLQKKDIQQWSQRLGETSGGWVEVEGDQAEKLNKKRTL
jgi:hypothetical protein